MVTIYWLIALAVFLIVEIATLGLTTIWFAGGALVAFFASLLGVDLTLQFVLFFVVSFTLLYFTRPIAIKYLNKSRTKTNVDSLVGKSAMVIETVDNKKATGQAIVNGQEWTARTNDESVIEKGEIANIVSISGVKLIIEKVKEDVKQ